MEQFYYIYVLRSKKDGKNYTGYTKNLKLRLQQHNSGKVESTKYRLPLALIYFEGCLNQQDATHREKYLKTVHLSGSIKPKDYNSRKRTKITFCIFEKQ